MPSVAVSLGIEQRNKNTVVDTAAAALFSRTFVKFEICIWKRPHPSVTPFTTFFHATLTFSRNFNILADMSLETLIRPPASRNERWDSENRNGAGRRDICISCASYLQYISSTCTLVSNKNKRPIPLNILESQDFLFLHGKNFWTFLSFFSDFLNYARAPTFST